jgi:RHS repeat-associated protein
MGLAGMLIDAPDSQSGLHTPNRQYNEWNGRWMRPDPAGLAAVDPGNPQTWNKYAYVASHPARLQPPQLIRSRQ